MKKAPMSGGDYELPEEKKYGAVVNGIWDIGTQKGQYGPKHKLILTYELHRKTGPACDAQGVQFLISNTYGYTVGGDNSVLKKHALILMDKGYVIPEDGFDPEPLLGRTCMIEVTHNKEGEKTYANIGAMMRHDSDDDYPIEPQHTQQVYELDTSRPIPDYVPKWVQKQIKKSLEWVAVHGEYVEEKQGTTKQTTNPATPAKTAPAATKPTPAATTPPKTEAAPQVNPAGSRFGNKNRGAAIASTTSNGSNGDDIPF